MYRARLPKRRAFIAPADDLSLPVETRARALRQDRERAELNRTIELGQATEQEYAALCFRQIHENLAASPMMSGMPSPQKREFNPDREILRRAAAELGLVVTEQ